MRWPDTVLAPLYPTDRTHDGSHHKLIHSNATVSEMFAVRVRASQKCAIDLFGIQSHKTCGAAHYVELNFVVAEQHVFDLELDANGRDE